MAGRRTAIRIAWFSLTTALIAAALLVHRTWPVEPWTLGGLFVLNFGAWGLVHLQLRREVPQLKKRVASERLLWITALLGIGGAQLVQRAVDTNSSPSVAFLAMAPIAAQALVSAALVGSTTAIIGVTLTCLLMAVAGSVPVWILAPAWICGAIGAHLVNPLRKRGDLFRAVTILAAGMAVGAAGASAAQMTTLFQVGEASFWGVIAAVIAASIFWFGTMVLERLFGLTSDWSLLELCSPDHPLLQEMMLRAPGTYAHSMAVASLAEQAARAVGANSVVCRAMATYHDVGKTKHPSAFIENQVGGNLHDNLPPTVSAQIIVSHVQDGLDMAVRHNLPQVILDGIAEHHGTSLVGYFYQRAIQDAPDDMAQSIQKLFRYPGPKPQTRETAILHLADQVEAASRVIGPDKDFDNLIGTIIDASRREGQLDESPLTFRDLRIIRRTFTRALTAMRHDRIAYPDYDERTARDDSESVEQTDSHSTP